MVKEKKIKDSYVERHMQSRKVSWDLQKEESTTGT